MPSSDASTPVTHQRRTSSASLWLARSRVTTSCQMKAMIGSNCVTVHAASSGRLLFSLSWADQMIEVKESELEESVHFYEMKTAVTFLEAVLLSYTVRLSEACATASDFVDSIVL